MNDFEPYGEDWEKEMMKWNKKQLINQIRTEWIKPKEVASLPLSVNYGVNLIAKERLEQIEKHGFDAKHDGGPGHSRGELAQAAGYLLTDVIDPVDKFCNAIIDFPSNWSKKFQHQFDQKTDIEKLITAGALIAAEIDRLKRF